MIIQNLNVNPWQAAEITRPAFGVGDRSIVTEWLIFLGVTDRILGGSPGEPAGPHTGAAHFKHAGAEVRDGVRD